MALDTMLFVGKIDVFRQQGIDTVLDKVQNAGIRSLVLGDLVIDGSPAFDPDRDYYTEASHSPPSVSKAARPKAEVFRHAVEQAKQRGLELYLHDWGLGAAGNCFEDEQARIYGLARTRDVKRAFPEIDGYVFDGPEFGYEIKPGHRSDLFRWLSEHELEKAKGAGFDVEAMRRDRAWLMEMVKRIDTVSARDWLQAEFSATDMLDLFMTRPGLVEWFRFRSHSILEFLTAFRDCIKGMDERLAIACGPRISAFAPLTGYNYGPISQVVDFFCPKVYLWHEGVDGLKGTIGRYAETLIEWNPALNQSLAIAVVCKLFGTPLPGMVSIADLSKPFPPEFFARTLSSEIDKAILRCGDAAKIRPFLGLHHGGVHMSSEEMEGILAAIECSPCDKVLYWEYGDLSDEQWTILGHYAKAS